MREGRLLLWSLPPPEHFAPALGVSSGSTGRSAPAPSSSSLPGGHLPHPSPMAAPTTPCPVAHAGGPYNPLPGAILLLDLGLLRPEFKSAPFQLPAVRRMFPKLPNIFSKMDYLSPKLIAKYWHTRRSKDVCRCLLQGGKLSPHHLGPHQAHTSQARGSPFLTAPTHEQGTCPVHGGLKKNWVQSQASWFSGSPHTPPLPTLWQRAGALTSPLLRDPPLLLWNQNRLSPLPQN